MIGMLIIFEFFIFEMVFIFDFLIIEHIFHFWIIDFWIEEIRNQNSGPEGQNFDSEFPVPHT